MKISSALGGLAGACALTLINEGFKRIDKNVPRLDLLGMNAVAKLTGKQNALQPLSQKLKPMSFVGDLISNSLYYGMAAGGSRNQTLMRGALLGLGAGLGAVVLPKSLGINDAPTNLTTKTKVLTVAWYLVGGLVAAAVINAMEGNKKALPASFLTKHRHGSSQLIEQD